MAIVKVKSVDLILGCRKWEVCLILADVARLSQHQGTNEFLTDILLIYWVLLIGHADYIFRFR